MTGIFDQLTSSNADKKNDEELQSADKHSHATEAVENLSLVDAGSPVTLKQIKEVSQQLLKYGLLESATKPGLYQAVLTHQQTLNTIFEPLDLALKIDDIRGLAFVVVVVVDGEGEDDDQWSHPLVRRQRLNLEQSLLIAILRRHFVNHELEAGVGGNIAVIHLDDLLPELNAYLGEMGSEIREDKRLRNLLEQLKGYGIVSDVNEHEQVTVRPLIAHVANPENLKNLLATFANKAGNASMKEGDASMKEGNASTEE
jgi:hypothetical protein